MSDGYVRIGTEIDQTGLDKGLKDVDKKLKETGKTTEATSANFLKMGLAVAGVAAAVKTASAVVSDLTESYKKQAKAETQLESAAKNNPYLDDSSVQRLKNYASQLQSISTTGDEELIPFMAQLASSGRTQQEIMDIMSASLDIAASGAMSMEAAVRNLNKSFGGFSGELGETIPEIKALTTEQLRAGGAVKLLAGRYKGMAESVAGATGSYEQLMNAVGDAKEELGAGFERAMAPMNRFFTGLVAGWADAAKKKREYNDAKADIEQGVITQTNLEKTLTGERAKLAILKKEIELSQISTMADSDAIVAVDYLAEARKEEAKRIGINIQALEEQLEVQRELDANAEAAKKKGAAEAKTAADLAKRNQDATDYIAANTAAREKAIQQILLQAEAEGVEADQLDILNAYVSSYVSLINESGGLVTRNNGFAKGLFSTVVSMTEEYAKQNELQLEAVEIQEKLKAIMDAIELDDTRPESEKMKARLSALDTYYSEVIANEQVSVNDKLAIEKEYADKRAILSKQITETEKQELKDQIQAQRDKNAEIAGIASQFATQYASIMQSINDLATQAIEDEAAIKIAKLEEQYNAGEISAEEYASKVEEIEQKAAEEKYKLDMWVWSANLLSAVANTAVGATQALAQGGIIGPILAALVGAAGAVQLAAIIASKPIPPSFATGGIVGGTSYTGDKVTSLVNSGEMILNAGQQRNLFDKINGNSMGGASGPNIQIYNSASNDVSAKPEITEDGVKLMIRKTVSKDMADGRFNNSYRTMQNELKGVRLTN